MTGKAWAREEEEKARISLAWYTEAFARYKRLPDLELLLAGGELAEQSPDDIMSVLLSFQEGGAAMEVEELDEEQWLAMQ